MSVIKSVKNIIPRVNGVTRYTQNNVQSEVNNHVKLPTSPTSFPNNDRLRGSDDFSIKFTTIKDRVKSIVKSDKFARRNYLWLDILYYHKMGMLKIVVPEEDFHKANSPEAINRAFRKLVEETNEGLHPDLNFILKDEILDFRERQKKRYKKNMVKKNG